METIKQPIYFHSWERSSERKSYPIIPYTLNNRNPETGHESISRSQKYTMQYTVQSYGNH